MHNRKKTQRLLAIGLLSLIVMMSILVLSLDYRNIRRQLIESNIEEAKIAGKYVDLYLTGLKDYISLLGGQPAFRDFELEKIGDIIQYELTKPEGKFSSLSLFDLNKNYLAGFEQELPVGVYDLILTENIKSSVMTVSNVFEETNRTRMDFFSIASCIVNNQGEKIGILVANVSLRKLKKDMSQYQVEDSKYIVVVDENKRTVYHPKVESLTKEQREAMGKILSDIDSGTSGYIEKTSFLDQQRKLFIYTPINNSRWSLLLVESSINLTRKVQGTILRKGIILLVIYGTLFKLYLLYMEVERKERVIQSINMDRYAALGQIAAGVAHEIKNPLAIVRGYLQLHELQGDEPIDRSVIKLMVGEMDRASSIVEEFLSIGKRRDPQIVSCDMQALVEDVLHVTQYELKRKNIMVEKLFDTNRSIQGDPQQLKQVLVNIIRNGIEAMEGSGQLTIRTYVEEGLHYTTITDTGKGIPKEITPFLGHHPLVTTKENGTGLGLSVSYEIINAHGGTINFKTKEEVGTTFIIGLPYERSES